MMPILVPVLGLGEELAVTEAQAALLVRMSTATIDEKLKGVRSTMLQHGRTHTKPRFQLKSQIPMRTWTEWDDAVPGFAGGEDDDFPGSAAYGVGHDLADQSDREDCPWWFWLRPGAG